MSPYIVQDPNFNLLYQYVIHTKLDGYLSGAAGPLTFFAPNNTGTAWAFECMKMPVVNANQGG